MAGKTNCRDLRYEAIDKAITDAFLLLCREKAPDKITVLDIIKRAGIVRSTFYNHYKDMPSLISAVETKVSEDIFGLMNHFQTSENVDIHRAYFLAFCNYAVENGFLQWHLKHPYSTEFVRKIIIVFHRYDRGMNERYLSEKGPSSEEAYASAYSIGGLIGLLHKWASGGCTDSPEYVAEIATRVFLEGMGRFVL